MTRRSLALLAVLLGLGYAWLTPGSLDINNPNENVRIYMVRAIAEEHTYAIAGRTCMGPHACRDRGRIYDQWGYVNDKAITCLDGGSGPDCSGSLYAGKAPGISFLGVVPHAVQRGLWRAVGWGEPSKAAVIAWLRFWCVVLPSIAGWLWLAWHLGRTLGRWQAGLAAVLLGAFGSLSLTYGMMFAGHQVGGALAAWGAGALHDSTGSYRPAFILAGVACVVAALGVRTMRRGGAVAAAAEPTPIAPPGEPAVTGPR